MHNDETKSSPGKNHLHRYFHYTESILSSYDGTEPFHLYLKKYFSLHKKHGSRDRKLITSLCYNYFRINDGVSDKIVLQDKLLLAIFLCENRSSILLEFFKPDWNTLIELPLLEKTKIVSEEFDLRKVFPFPIELSSEVDFFKFNFSFLLKPKLFIRIRPTFEKTVIKKINNAGLSYEKLNDECLAFSNNEKIGELVEPDKEVVVQDYNSQQTLHLLTDEISTKKRLSVWDCCAGSGGKSILAFDMFENVKLTVSDKRKSILVNLKLRFEKAGIKNYELIVADLEKSVAQINNSFDLIVADVPCSGSGTWSRTPEQLSFFNNTDVEKYASQQRRIIEHVLPHLKSSGYLLYITCSVFKKENEDNVDFIQQKFDLQLLKMEYLKGYEMQADTLFAALLKKN